VVDGRLALLLVVFIKKMTIRKDTLEHGVQTREAPEKNIYRLILVAGNELQLWLHKDEMFISNM
jgi:hypothetical protein